MMKKLDFVYFEAGEGHRAAADALKSVIEEQQCPWQVRLVDLQEILDPLDIFRKYTSIRMEDVYNLLLKKGWTLGSPQLTVLMHALIRLYHPARSGCSRNSGPKASGSGSLADSQFQSRATGKFTFHSVPDASHRSSRLSATLLD